MNTAEIYNLIDRAIENSESILITTHENPDGDALASMLAFYLFLQTLNKRVYLFCYNEPDPSFYFLPNVKKIISDKSKIPIAKIDLAILLDCGSINRSRLEVELESCQSPIINIDHHFSNTNFGSINLVDCEAVSTTQILYNFFKHIKIKISKEIAQCILTGLLTDSGNFAYAATNSATFTTASELLLKGANVRDIINAFHKNKKIATLKIWGLAMNRLEHNRRYDIAYTILTRADMDELKVNPQDLEGLSSFLNNTKDAKIILVLYELGDARVKGSFRTNGSGIDVSRLAQIFGGGGHKKAAGFEIEGKLQQTESGWKIT